MAIPFKTTAGRRSVPEVIGSYLLVFPAGSQTRRMEVLAVDMGSWILFECEELSSSVISYVGWDIGAPAPEWIEMNQGVVPEFAPALISAIVNYNTAVAG